MPVNVLIIRALLNLYHFYGNDFKVQCPTGSGHYMTLFEVAQELSRRLAGTSARCQWTPASIRRHRKVPGGSALARSDPVLRILSWRQRRGARRKPSDRMDWIDRASARCVRAYRGQGLGVGIPRPRGPGDAGAGGFGKEERKLKFAFAQVFDVQDELTENQTGEI